MRPWWLRYKRGWFVWNPGAGGGGGTVQTDGVTIQGDGSSGNKIALKQVETDGTITGAGTIASPLSVVSNALTFFTLATGPNPFATSQNQTDLTGFVLPYKLTFSKISVHIGTADAGNNSDIGIYTAAGVLVADIGAQALASGGDQTIATVQGAKTIGPGLYLFAITTAGTALTIFGGQSSWGWILSATGGVTSGGALNATITAPVASLSSFAYGFALS